MMNIKYYVYAAGIALMVFALSWTYNKGVSVERKRWQEASYQEQHRQQQANDEALREANKYVLEMIDKHEQLERKQEELEDELQKLDNIGSCSIPRSSLRPFSQTNPSSSPE